MKRIRTVHILTSLLVVFLVLSAVCPVYAMHIAEGYLPVKWSILYSVIYLPFLIFGIISVNKKCKNNPRLKMLLAMAGAFCFVLSALKIPSVTGSSSHPTGVGLATILFGPLSMSFLGFIVLLFQALLLAHGGITTLGANALSMAVAGPFLGYLVYYLLNKLKAPKPVSVFFTAFTADLFTYVVTSFQLAFVFHSETVSFTASLVKFMSVFAVTQIPLAISEGILTVLVYKAISIYCDKELKELRPLWEVVKL